MTTSNPAAAEPAGSEQLGILYARLARLAQAWDVEAARTFAADLHELHDAAQGVATEALDNFLAYYSAFADGAQLPTRNQCARLVDLFALVVSPVAAQEGERDAGVVVPLPPRRPSAVEARRTVALLDVTDKLAPGLTTSLTERGFEVRPESDVEAMEAYLERNRPGIVIVNVRQLRILPRLAAKLGDAKFGSPLGPSLLVVSGSRDLTHRLLAMRVGATAFFGAPLDSYSVVARIEELLGREETTPNRVLLVDSSREHAAQCGRWLVEQGMTARLAFDSRSALAAAIEFRPDIALIDLSLPDARGFEVAQILHQQPEFATLPVVLFGEEVDDVQRFDAIAAGADDVLVKPLKSRHLTSVIASRVRRAQLLRGHTGRLEGRDPHTGLLLRARMLERLAQPGFAPGAALLFVALDRAEELRARIGLAGLAQLELELAQVFRETLARGDVAAPMRDFAYLVLLAREERDEITRMAERLRQKFTQRLFGSGPEPFAVATSIGISLLEGVEANVDARVERAEAAAGLAQQMGGNRVSWYEARSRSPVAPNPELAVRAVLSRPWREENWELAYRPLVPLTGKIAGQFDLEFDLVSTTAPIERAGYRLYAPIASQMGLLGDLERRRLGAALAARESCLKLGRQVRVFLPLIADSLADGELVRWLIEALAQRGLSGNGLTIEMPSAELVDRRIALADNLALLREAGIRLGLIDFGRDWAAVHLLTQLPLDFLRLDPELVLNTTNANAVSTTLLALVRKAHHLGSAVIAPGIDAVERAHILIRMGIDYGVGDGLGRAQREPEFDFDKPIW